MKIAREPAHLLMNMDQMMIASQVTDNNIQKAEDVIKDSVDYIFEKINEGK